MMNGKKSIVRASEGCSDRSRATTRVRPYDSTDFPLTRRYSRGGPSWSPWFFTLLGVIALVAALWSYMLLTASTHQTLDQRVQHIGSQLKCPVCQGESVADAPVGLAQEMRGIIRQKVQAGESDQQIIQFFIDRYGEQIVWSPPWWGFSLFAWLVPIGLLLGGASLLFFTLRDWRSPMTATSTIGAMNNNNTASQEDAELANMDEEELARYRVQLEHELADEDALFGQTGYMGRAGRTEAQ